MRAALIQAEPTSASVLPYLPADYFNARVGTLLNHVDLEWVEFVAHEQLSRLADLSTSLDRGLPNCLVVDAPGTPATHVLVELCSAIEGSSPEAREALTNVIIRLASLDTIGSELVEYVAQRAEALDFSIHLMDSFHRGRLERSGVVAKVQDAIPLELLESSLPGVPLSLSTLRPAFGHFAYQLGMDHFHTNLLLLAEEVPQESHKALRDIVAPQGADITVGVLGEAGALLRHAALVLAGSDSQRVFHPTFLSEGPRPAESGAEDLDGDYSPAGPVGGRPSVVLVDAITTPAHLQQIEALLHRAGWGGSRLFALCRGPEVLCDSAVVLSDVAFREPSWNCPYCQAGVAVEPAPPYGQGEELQDRVFWDMCAWDADQLVIGHWRSNRTDYHFNIRVEAEPLFERFAHGLSYRFRNLLLSTGVITSWVDGIVCTDGAESADLAEQLRLRLSVRRENVIKVTRKTINAVISDPNGSAIDEWIAEQGDVATGWSRDLRNVVLLDQAAHHFRTLGVLQRVASALSAQSLAFLVLIDVTESSDDKLTQVAGLHYLPLFRWACPPIKASACQCRL